MLLEFSSARAPGAQPAAGRWWHRSVWPGIAVLATGGVLLVGGDQLMPVIGLFGQILALLGGGMIGARLVRRRAAATREPRRWTITDDQLRAANRLGSVRLAWDQVRRVDERPDVYLLYQGDSRHAFAFDVPRDGLTADQDGQLRAFLIGRGLLPAG